VDHTQVSAVQLVGQFDHWPTNVTYVGMPGKASRAFGIPDGLGLFGKPWACLNSPLGWPTAYNQYLVGRLANEPWFEEQVRALHGRTLLCWCVAKPDAERCHAFILREFVELLYHGSSS
jgi:hypothetical protein